MLKRVLLVLGHIWASPNSLIGLLAAVLGGARPKQRLPAGVWQWVGTHFLWAKFFEGDYWAITFGAISIVDPGEADDPTVQRHERRHTLQSLVLGPFFLPLYLLEWGWEMVHDAFNEPKAYRDIPLEVAAYAAEKKPDSFG